ncbi:sensor histidine kinase [Marinobacterium sediminicola]|uniref:histidine kinase n=1 Tax=Marinobacterium sediminicola TaxID=518898 RepID=A0ABY1RYT6_9GAMM|nr:ATP-binding protein [Marinobacterium sediminicola]ULG67994.1 ATP-binding protein [Marinobacterium sediminicola]SMR73496.1 Cache domain-containing protein [Marinobacterium sediminicola]
MIKQGLGKGKSVFRVLWGTYIRNALIPIIFIELALIVAYLVTNYLVRDQNIATMQRSAQESLLETARIESDVITAQLQGVAEMTDLFAALVTQAYDQPYVPDDVELSRYLHSDSGVWYTRPETPGAAMFYSSITDIGDAERAKAWQLVQIDPLMRQLVESSALVTQAYLNTHDSMNRIYPSFNVLEQYPVDLNVRDYNFYYEADAEHNPERQVVWTDVYIDPAGQGWMASAIAPVYRKGSDFLEGVVGLDIQVSEIIRQVLALKLPWDSYALLVDSTGTIMAMPQSAEYDWQLRELTDHDYATAIKQDTFKPEEFNLFRRIDSRPLAQNLDQSSSGVVALELNGQPKLAAWSRIPGADWHLLVVADQARLYADANALKDRVDQIAVAMILALLAFYVLFMIYLYQKSVSVSLRLSEPMRALRQMIRLIGQGQYRTQPVESDILELSAVSAGLSDMATTLEHSRSQLDEANRRLEGMNQALELRVEERTQKLKQANKELRHEREAHAGLIRKLKETQAQLVQSEKMASVGVLATGVAHEINNPLAFVSANVAILNDYVPALVRLYQGAVELIDEGERTVLKKMEQREKFAYMEEDLPDLLADSLEGIRRIRHITESLLEFSHAGDTAWQECDINHCVETTLVICRHEYKNRAEVITELDPKLPKIQAVPAQINQVIMALVVNAAQALQLNGCIRISTSREDGEIRLVVDDNGSGIAPEELNHIFEPFYTTKDVGQGTGLGLAVTYGIVNAHHGRIEVDSTPGEGSRFTVILPINQGAQSFTSDME